MVIELPFCEALRRDSEIPSTRRRPSWFTDETTRTKLHKTEADVALGERHISNQRARIARLEKNGSDAALAKELLNTFLQVQQLHQHHRNQLKRELAWSPKP